MLGFDASCETRSTAYTVLCLLDPILHTVPIVADRTLEALNVINLGGLAQLAVQIV